SVAALWAIWWLRDAAGALVLTPAIVLWASLDARAFKLDRIFNSAIALIAAVAVGLVVFSPLIRPTRRRGGVAVLAGLSLGWSALRCGPRDTATVVLILSGCAIWGMVAGGGVFADVAGSESILLPIMFMISTAIVRLAWSADVADRQRVEGALRLQEHNLRAM